MTPLNTHESVVCTSVGSALWRAALHRAEEHIGSLVVLIRSNRSLLVANCSKLQLIITNADLLILVQVYSYALGNNTL